MKIVERVVDSADRVVLSTALGIVGQILGGSVFAVMVADEAGAYFHIRPGSERDVCDVLAGVNWPHFKRMIEEHT